MLLYPVGLDNGHHRATMPWTCNYVIGPKSCKRQFGAYRSPCFGWSCL